MLGTVADIQKKGGEYITRIEQSGDLDASLALLLTFVRNYCGIAERFNARFCSWAEFYRRNILHDTPKTAVQDSTLIVIDPDRKKITETFPLPKGTKFTAGKRRTAPTCAMPPRKRHTSSRHASLQHTPCRPKAIACTSHLF